MPELDTDVGNGFAPGYPGFVTADRYPSCTQQLGTKVPLRRNAAATTLCDMKKRVAAGILWAFAAWYAWNYLAYATGLPMLLAPFVGIAVGLFVGLDPMSKLWARPRRPDAESATLPALEPDAA